MSKLCFGCMQQKEESPICEHCGYDERQDNLSHQLPVGTILQNQYLVGKVLGQGGFGITYIGWDQHLSIPVAIKEYFPGGVVQRHTRLSTKVSCVNGEAPDVFAKHRERFLKEARTLAKLADISGIVQIKSYFSTNDTAYIVMEYVQGITLKDRLKQLGRPMTEQEALEIMKTVLSALLKVHDQGLIHRDISPDNIMLPESGGIKLIDFGTVRYIDDSGKSKSTETVLKPGFAPMEQYITRGKLGTWTDVYALCATFHYLLTGKVPEESMARLDSDGTLPMLRSRQDLSSGLIDVLELGMGIRVSDRIQTVEQLYRMLYSGKGPGTENEMNGSRGAGSSRAKRIIAAAAVVAVLAVGAGILLPKKEGPVPDIPVTEATAPAPETQPQIQPVGPSMQNEIEIRYQEAVSLEQEGENARAAIAFGKLGNYQDSRERSFELWTQIAHRETFSTDAFHTVGLRTDGRVLAAGENVFGQNNVEDWEGIIAISASSTHTVGLKDDGTVVAVGANHYGQCDVESWTDIVAVLAFQASQSVPAGEEPAIPYAYTLGLRTDGTVVAAGYNEDGQCDVESWTDVVSFAAGSCRWDNVYGCQTVALRVDGTALAAGTGTDSWCNVSDWEDLVDISACGAHVVGVKSDGTAVAVGTPAVSWGLVASRYDVSGWQDIVKVWTHPVCTIGLRSDGTMVAVGNNDLYNNLGVSRWQDITGFARSDHNVGLRADGTVVGVGSNDYGQRNFYGWSDVAAVYTGMYHTVGIRRDGTVLVTGDNEYGQCDITSWDDLVVPE